MSTRRLGKFKITKDLLDNPQMQYTLRTKVFPALFICRAEYLYAEDCIEYVAESHIFDEVPFGYEIPNYNLMITVDNLDVFTVSAERVQ